MALLEALVAASMTIGAEFFPQPAEIVFAGDAMQHKVQLDAAKSGRGYDFSKYYTEVDDLISAADYAVVNLETPVGSALAGYPCFGAPVEYAVALKDAGFDMMLTANNHTLDRGDAGLLRTIAVLDSLEVDHIGTYANAAKRAEVLPCIVDIKGFKVGFLNYTYGTNGIKPGATVVVDYDNQNKIARDIKATRDAGAEIICVAMHWGIEYELVPRKVIKTFANFLKKQGVDIIFGGHPHVIQPMELAVNPATGRNTALFYSLGNFVSGMNTRDTRGGAIAKVALRRDINGNAYVDDLSYRLVFTLTPETGGKGSFKVVPAESVDPSNTNCKDFVKSAEGIFNKHNVNVKKWN